MAGDGETVGHPGDIIGDAAQAGDLARAALPAGGQMRGMVAVALREVADDALRLDADRGQRGAIIEMRVEVALQRAFVGLDLASWPSLEAQVAAIADDIASDNHDIDDGLRAGILDFDALLAVPFVARLWAAIEARHPGLDPVRKVKALVRDGIGTMVGDVLAETCRRVAESGVASIDDVRAAGRQLVGFSAPIETDERALKRHLYAHLYNSDAVQRMARRALQAVFGQPDPHLRRYHPQRGLRLTHPHPAG